MKNTILQKLVLYLYNNFLGNFLGFIVGMASTRVVSHFFATRSIRNLWGLTSKKTLIDKQTYSILEYAISILIGFIVFEIISKGVKKKTDEMMPSWKLTIKTWLQKSRLLNVSANTPTYSEKNAATANARQSRIFRDVQ
ncbi:MAG TPA: hypothetical protein VKA49_03700 [Flavitalea sp.]|nr:hypothetical protein [Flavitalea sp.]